MLWAAVSVGFSQFLANFGNYNEVYGSIGAVIALLMWFYLSAWVVLFGAVLDVALDAASRENPATPP
jgi:membrane protein